MSRLRVFLLLAALALLPAAGWGQGGQTTIIRSGPTVPATCNPTRGEIFFKNTAPVGTYQCDATNTFTKLSTGVGGGSGATVSTELSDFSSTPASSSGQIPIWDNSAGMYIPGDPLVQGLTSHDAVGTSTNPVAMGGYASASAPSDVSGDGDIVRAWFLRNGAQVVNVANSSLAVTGTFWQATQPVSGTFWQATQPVSGTVTANAGTNLNTSALALNTSVDGVEALLGTIDADTSTLAGAVSGTEMQVDVLTMPTVAVTGTFWQATQPVSGTFWQVTQPVSGTFWQATQPVSGPLTDTQLRASPVEVDCTTCVSGGALTDTELRATDVDVNVTNSSFAVTGTFWQATQPVSGTVTVTDGAGALNVICDSGCTPGGSFEDNDAFTFDTTAVNVMGAVVDDTTTNTVDENSAGAPRMSTNRVLYVDLVNTQANATALTVDGSGVTQPVSGTFWQATQPVSAAALPLPTGAATEATLAALAPLTDTELRATPLDVAGTVDLGATDNAVLDAIAASVAAIGTDTTTIIGHVDGLEGFVDGIEGLIGTTNTNTGNSATSLAIVDDWDESDRAKVNIIVGQAGVAAGTGVDGVTVPRVTLATNVPLPAGTNGIGKLTANSGVDIGDVTIDNASLAVTQSTSPWIVAGGGTAGSAATGVVTVQGITSMTPLLATVTATNLDVQIGGSDSLTIGTFPDNEPFNVAQINGVTVLMGNGATGTGSQRVTIANDSSAIAVKGEGGIGAAPPSGAQLAGGITSGATGGFMAGIPICDSFYNINVVTATTTLWITGVSGRHVRICSISMVASAAENVALISGTGATCGTGTAAIVGTTSATGFNFAANGGLTQGNGIGTIMRTVATGDSICAISSSTAQLSGVISYTIY